MSTEEVGALGASVRLPPLLMSAGSARRFLSATLDGWHIAGDVSDLATLLTSELVGNAIRHGDGDVLLTIRTPTPPGLRIEVHDDGQDVPVLRGETEGAENDRGLWLVEALAERWGVVSYRDDGKDVWFELDTAGSRA